jgi:hypothetical protein
MPSLTAEQIIALAPDQNSAKAGKELASARRWVSLGKNERAVWGECQGSAKEPYQTQIDLSEPAFKCSCPSRKFPCKHTLGLFLLFAAQPNTLIQTIPPAWVDEWITKRTLAAQKPAKAKSDNPTETSAVVVYEVESLSSPEAARRAARREERVREGLEDLDLWLSDLVRQGLSAAQSKPQAFWETPAARLVDAQAPGLARRVREIASIPDIGEGWQERLLSQVGKLFLLIKAYQHLTALPTQTQADVRTLIGWTQDQDELLQQLGIVDNWLVLGKRVVEDTIRITGKSPVLKVQRTWLFGQITRQYALILSFAAPGQVLDTSLIPGASFEAELVYYPGGFPLRALVKRKMSAPVLSGSLVGFANLSEALTAFSTALTANPWLEDFPMLLAEVTPIKFGEAWGIQDKLAGFLPFAPGFPLTWNLEAISGGHALSLFCEWKDDRLWPLSAWAEGRFIPLQLGNAEG